MLLTLCSHYLASVTNAVCRAAAQNKHEKLQSVEGGSEKQEKKTKNSSNAKKQHESERRRLPRNPQMDLHFHLGVTVLDFLPRNHLPQKITEEDNICVISLLLHYLHISCFK